MSYDEEGPGYADFAGGGDPEAPFRQGDPKVLAAAASAAPFDDSDRGRAADPELPPGTFGGDTQAGDAEWTESHLAGLGAAGGGVAPGGGSGGTGGGGHWPEHGEAAGEGFVSGGRHVLFCGADIPMETLQAGHWEHPHRRKGVDPLRAVGDSLLHPQPPGAGLPPRHASDPGVRRGRAGAGAGPGQGEAEVEDDLTQVEVDTPAGYHVAAAVLHPADAADAEELVVTATAVTAPAQGGGGTGAY
ncbi:hypothetical protein HYH03_012343 [Edaphochlamys debaryana]|uniref:Uncharacterized protein n=1 Tax=Edaphochlamys debaryana TaxID=47281 RepID=A0A836BUJ1_9CHLO|nr:hypothetical protein HYH03_012343 [Edaphochlamys debaryana]|eukprot:KAG2489117.1 hypothetical protein HYH03_012343 [Edaphochlamys debaryana]